MFPASIIEPQTPINRTQNQPSNDDSRRRSRVLSGGKFKVLFVVVPITDISDGLEVVDSGRLLDLGQDLGLHKHVCVRVRVRVCVHV